MVENPTAVAHGLKQFLARHPIGAPHHVPASANHVHEVGPSGREPAR